MRALNTAWASRTLALPSITVIACVAALGAPLRAVPPASNAPVDGANPPTARAATDYPASKQANVRRSAPLVALQPLVSDGVLQARVRLALEDDPQTRAFASQATVHGGRVILTGETYHPEQRAQAESIVRQIAGVHDVLDRIALERNADLEIAHKLHAAFSTDPTIDDAAIGVSVIHGRVALSGTAESAEDVTRINSIVLNTPGVVSVSNGLQVSPSPLQRRLPVGRTYSTYPAIRR